MEHVGGCGTKSISIKDSYGRLGNADLQHHIRAVDCTRDSTKGAGAYSPGPLRSAPASTSDERDCYPDSKSIAEVDPVGSLVDADMAAYYQWINQQRLAGYDRSSFLVWFEGRNDALVVAPTLPRGAQSSSSMNLGDLLSLAVG